MRDEFQLPDTAPGHYLPLRADQDLHKAYLPDNLPPTIELSDEVVRELARAMHALGRLDGLGSEVENPGAVFGSFVYKEAEQSSQVEGTAVTISDIYRLETGEPDAVGGGESTEHARDVQEARNYVRALEEGREYLQMAGRARENVTLELVKSLHETLMEHGRTDGDDPLPGEFRPGLVAIEETDEHGWKQVRFVPPTAEMVDGRMKSLEQYIQSPSRWPDLVDVALVHYQFETIHPFRDGNGRVGRLLVVLLLLCCDLLVNPLLYPSSYFKRHRAEYTDRLLAVSERGEWEEWIHFFLSGIRQQADEAFVRAKLLLRKRREYGETYSAAPKSVRALVGELFGEPYFSISEAAEMIDMSYGSARNAIERLEEDGVVGEETKEDGARVYRAAEIMDLVERPAGDLPTAAEIVDSEAEWKLPDD